MSSKDNGYGLLPTACYLDRLRRINGSTIHAVMQVDPAVIQYLVTIVSAAVPAWFAAYFGARWSLRKTRSEIAFERRLKWTEGVFSTLDELSRTLHLFDRDSTAVPEEWLSATGRAMIQLNLQELYASQRAMDALQKLGGKVVALRSLLRNKGDSKDIIEARDELVEELAHSMDVLAYDVRQHLGIATSTDRGVLGARKRWRATRLAKKNPA